MTKRPANTYAIRKDFYDKLGKFSQKVLKEGFDIFEEEFAQIDGFVEKAEADSNSRDDHQFRRTRREMYLLEALYYDIFSRVNLEEFNKAKHTAIILPQCLAARVDKCERKERKYGKVCTHCAPKCQVSDITKMAKEFHVDCYFSKRQMTEQLQAIKKRKKSLSVIGVSCILTLASGMRTAHEAGIPAQGVYLNFTGCDHWADKAFPTETTIDRLKDILEKKYGIPDQTA